MSGTKHAVVVKHASGALLSIWKCFATKKDATEYLKRLGGPRQHVRRVENGNP